MTTSETGWRRDREGLGIWPGRGKVAIAGWGQSPVDRRWDGVSMDKTIGAYAMLACQQAIEDAGVKPEEVDGLICCPESMAGSTGGSSAVWAPRPYFDPPYDSEDGLTLVTGQWLLKNMHLPNVKYAPEHVPAIGEQMGMAAQAVADGRCSVALVVYTGGNLEGRYRMGGANADNNARGSTQWLQPWGQGAEMRYTTSLTMQEYCTKYGTTWDEVMAPLVINQRRNGLMHSWGFYTLHEPDQFTEEDYKNGRFIIWPLRIYDCDRPVNEVSAFLFTTAERAKDMRQKPVYVLNHNQGGGGQPRSTSPTLSDMEAAVQRAARMAFEGSGLRAEDVDIFNPYDGYAPFMAWTLEGFQWHGAKNGDAKDFFNGDISVEGPHPFSSGGGNLGSGRTRSVMYIDSIEQLRGTAGKRQVTVKAETAICGFAPGGSANYISLANDVS